MAYTEELLNDVVQGLKNTEKDILFLLNTKEQKVIKTSRDMAGFYGENHDLVIIEPMLKDIMELMEDFALEQDTEEIQEHLLTLLKNRERSSAVKSFYRALLDYPRSKKNWQMIEDKWLKERALELLDDYIKLTPVL
ncbi:MAG: hypothetical protein K0B81_01890 [Candidatus Cloacimonetes bacterium]|nr:hypothetical protein [Candidatus Cloacimonadota bacterium]